MREKCRLVRGTRPFINRGLVRPDQSPIGNWRLHSWGGRSGRGLERTGRKFSEPVAPGELIMERGEDLHSFHRGKNMREKVCTYSRTIRGFSAMERGRKKERLMRIPGVRGEGEGGVRGSLWVEVEKDCAAKEGGTIIPISPVFERRRHVPISKIAWRERVGRVVSGKKEKAVWLKKCLPKNGERKFCLQIWERD